MSMLRCSQISADLDEAMVGTAPEAIGWVALEQNGPWGARAFTSSHLERAVGEMIERRCAEHGLRPCLIRRPGRHADPGDRPSRTVLVSHGVPGRTWLLRGSIDDPADLLGLDWAAVREGDLASVVASLPSLEPEGHSHLLVCTNGARDLCCALEGRAVAGAVCVSHPDRVWETTHTSGHRFAPTGVVLPSGYLHGRLSAPEALEVLAAADRGETVLGSSRGRSCWPRAGQVADHVVRDLTGEVALDSLELRSLTEVAGGRQEAVVDHLDGRRWQVSVKTSPGPQERPESCGKPPVSMSEITAEVAQIADTAR